MSIQNKILLYAIVFATGVAVYLQGGQVTSEMVQIGDSRTWLLIYSALMLANFALAIRFKNSWPVSMGRMLVAGLFAYIGISHLVDYTAEVWGSMALLWGLETPESNAVSVYLAGMRYLLVAWTVALVMMLVSVFVGFETEDADDDSSLE